jgi:glycosyltransferase involved in cell wall biosynthesis
MQACDLLAHTSTAPEPFGRVIVEAMLCERPVVAAAAGGAVELIEVGEAGFLSSPGNSQELAQIITNCRNQPERSAAIAHQARIQASQRFKLADMNEQISKLVYQILPRFDVK